MDTRVAGIGDALAAACIYAAVVATCITLTPRLGLLPWIVVGAVLWASGALVETMRHPHHGER